MHVQDISFFSSTLYNGIRCTWTGADFWADVGFNWSRQESGLRAWRVMLAGHRVSEKCLRVLETCHAG